MVMNPYHAEQMLRHNRDGAEFVDMWKEAQYTNLPKHQSHIEGVELYRMGQTGQLARYPWHWHLFGDATGSYVKNSSVHDSFQRAYTIHGTQTALLEKNVAFNIIGHAYFLEDGAEWGNVLRENIVALVKSFPTKDLQLIPSDARPAGFYWSHPNNDFIGNVAAGSFGIGMHLIPKEFATGPSYSPTFRINDATKLGWGDYRDNVIHSTALVHRQPGYGRFDEQKPGSGIGLFVGVETGKPSNGEALRCRLISQQFRTEEPLCQFDNFTIYMNEIYGTWFYNKGSVVETVNSVYADNTIDYWNRVSAIEDNVFIDNTNNVGNPGKSGQGFVKTDYFGGTSAVLAAELTVGRILPWDRDVGRYGVGQVYPGIRSLSPPKYSGAAIIPLYDGVFFRNNVFIGYKDNQYYDSGILAVTPTERHASAGSNIVIDSEPYLPWTGSGGYRISIKDLDGSLTGAGSYREIRQSGEGNSIIYDSTCTESRDSGKYRICTGRTVWLGLPGGMGDRDLRDVDTGETIRAGHHWSHLTPQRTYEILNLDGSGLSRVFVNELHPDDWVAIKLPSSGPLQVTGWFAENKPEQIITVNSLSALYTSDTLVTLYYDSVNSMQYVRFTGDPRTLSLYEDWNNSLRKRTSDPRLEFFFSL